MSELRLYNDITVRYSYNHKNTMDQFNPEKKSKKAKNLKMASVKIKNFGNL